MLYKDKPITNCLQFERGGLISLDGLTKNAIDFHCGKGRMLCFRILGLKVRITLLVLIQSICVPQLCNSVSLN